MSFCSHRVAAVQYLLYQTLSGAQTLTCELALAHYSVLVSCIYIIIHLDGDTCRLTVNGLDLMQVIIAFVLYGKAHLSRLRINDRSKIKSVGILISVPAPHILIPSDNGRSVLSVLSACQCHTYGAVGKILSVLWSKVHSRNGIIELIVACIAILDKLPVKAGIFIVDPLNDTAALPDLDEIAIAVNGIVNVCVLGLIPNFAVNNDLCAVTEIYGIGNTDLFSSMDNGSSRWEHIAFQLHICKNSRDKPFIDILLAACFIGLEALSVA